MANDKIISSVVSALVDDAAKTVMKTASIDTVTSKITEEVRGIESKLSVMVSHIEGRYESEVANLKLELSRLTPKAPGFFARLFGRSK